MQVRAWSTTTALIVAAGAFALSGCGATPRVKPTAIAFEPRIVGCSEEPVDGCASIAAAHIRELREAHDHLCPGAAPDVLVKADGTLICVATLPSGGPAAIALQAPSATRSRGEAAVTEFKAGEVVAASTGCLACHRIGESGNRGPGSNLTHIGSRLPEAAINRALVDSAEPMPSFRNLPERKRRTLVYFLAQLR